MSKQEPSGDVPANVNVSGGQGIQVGTGNTQYNAWLARQPLDPVALSALNPHTAVARLQQLPDDELVDFFARAKPGDASEILVVFLEIDEARVIATLADINRRKATELIKAASVEAIMAELPEAAETIAREAAGLKWTGAEPLERFIGGYGRKYRNGHVCWAAGFGVFATVGVIDDYCAARGFGFGVPIFPVRAVMSSPFGVEGIRQDFLRGAVYSSRRGTFHVSAAGVECCDREEHIGGSLGFPVGEVVVNSSSEQLQHFEGGTIYFYTREDPVAFAVHREAVAALPRDGRWRPISTEVPVMSSSGTLGVAQHFEFNVVNSPESARETAVYSPEDSNPVMVALQVWDYYNRLGAEKSWLGFPAASRRFLPKNCGEQIFENGAIYWRGTNPVAVSAAVMNLIARRDGLRERIGYPVSEEQPSGANGSGRIQFFDNGVVTLSDGIYEAWLRP